MTPHLRALRRLLAVQAAWTYERMLGIGVGHASTPLLEEVAARRDPEARRAMVARSAEFFNAHPYLAGVAVGALARVEHDDAPGDRILRLRSALCGPLGALGDQLVWAGQVPVLIGLGLLTVPWFGGWGVLLVVIIHNLLRLWLTDWGLRLGWREGFQVGGAIQRSRLPMLADRVQLAAALMAGIALPVILAWLLDGQGMPDLPIGMVLAAVPVALGLGHLLGLRRLSGLKVGLLLLMLTLLLIGEFR